MRRSWLYFALVYAALALFFGAYAAIELRRFPLDAFPAATIYTCLLWLLGLYLAPGFPAVRAWLSDHVRGPCWAIGIFISPYLIYAAGTGDFRWRALGTLLLLAAVPLVLPSIAPVKDRRKLNWQDVLILLWLMLPVLFRWIGRIWNVPVNLDFMARLFLVGVGAWSFLIFRGVEYDGYDFRFSAAILRDSLISFLGFAAIAIPLGFLLRFTAWNPQWKGARAFAVDYLTIFLFVAIAEELFFRGLLQNLLEGSLGSRSGAQAAASIIFGLSHILHAPVPNWRYVILASIAGWFYGRAYLKHRSLMASATTHALVDTCWRTFFTLPAF